MSHIVSIQLQVTSLDALVTASQHCGLELVRSNTHKWYGQRVNDDQPLPEGFTEADLGKCDYELRIPNNSEAYSVGVVRRKDGQPGYELMIDLWNGGYGLEQAIGADGSKLKQEYAIAAAMKEMLRKGCRVQRTVNETTGKPQLIGRLA